MINKLALSLTALLASGTPAIASPYSMLRSNHLTQVVEQTGVSVKLHDQRCVTDDVYGFYQPSMKLMVICVRNHYVNGKMDYQELGDTLRHESMHVAQVCNGKGLDAVAILSWNQIAKYSNSNILSIVQRYPADRQHVEYEAFTAAATMTNTQVSKIVQDWCF